MVRGHGAKGKHWKVKFSGTWMAILCNFGCTPYVHIMYNGGTSTRSGHFLNMKPIEKIILFNI